MSDTFLDRAALAELTEAAGAEFASVLFTQIRADFARLHDAALLQMRTFSPPATPDWDTTHRIVHEMKGLSLTVGAIQLAQTCAQAETLAQNKDLVTLSRTLPEIIGVCDRVRIELEQCIAGAE
jgi:HPt (histidine-containing phosphotransfer) domain-containing protein